MEIAVLILRIVVALGERIAEALKEGDPSILDRPIRDILPASLLTTAEKAAADAKAAAHFGGA
jgi:hypothetical protein